MREFRFSARPNKAHLIEWRPWGDAAFAEAKQLDKPVFLEIVAFWCGACQRMDEVTFSDDEVIASLNANFLPIRVEEARRPDIDARYTQNGWPTLAILTPGGDHMFTLNSLGPKPMVDILAQAANTYHEKKEELIERVRATQTDRPVATPNRAGLNVSLVGEIAGMVQGLADPVHGGYGLESKFPHSEANDLFLYLYEVTGEGLFLTHVQLTLEKMRSSSMYHSEGGGGYYRYSSRLDWEEPHPEKLLDDQAGMLRNFLHTFLLTGDDFYRGCAEELIDDMDGTLLDADKGVFLGCQDYIRRVAGPEGVDGPLDSYLDDCVYADQNARAASAYMQAWLILGREDCRDRAVTVLEWLWVTLHQQDGGLSHYWDGEPLIYGLLLDAVAAGSAMLDAYALLGDVTQLQRALDLAVYVVSEHRNPAGGYSDISATGPGGLGRPLTLPAQNAQAAAFLTRLADLTGESVYREGAYWGSLAVRRVSPRVRRHGGRLRWRAGALLVATLHRHAKGSPGRCTDAFVSAGGGIAMRSEQCRSSP